MNEFPCDRPVTVEVRCAAGSVEVIAEERSTATVEVSPYNDSSASRDAAEGTRVEMHPNRLVVDVPRISGGGFLFSRGPKVRLDIRVPLDCPLDIRLASADLTGHGRFAEVNVKSASGDMYLEHVAGALVANAASGDIRLVRVDGPARFVSASGNLTAQAIGGDVAAQAASGDVELEEVDGSVQVTTASGDVRLGVARRGTVNVRSASGDVWVGVPSGTGVWLDLTTMSGSTRSDLSAPDPSASGGAQRADLRLQIRTMSGDIDIRRVEQRAAAA